MDRGKLSINIIANSIAGPMSGGDRIWIECARRWINKGCTVNVFTTEQGLRRGKNYGLDKANYTLWPSRNFDKYGLFVTYLARTIKGSIKRLLADQAGNGVIIYSSSDFWPDSIPAFIMKLRNKKTIWIAGFFLFAPKPWQRVSPYKGKKWFTGLFYWATQLPIYWIVKKFADMVFVTSEPDVGKFVTKKRDRDKIIVIRGGVDIDPSKKYLNSEEVIPVKERKYEAVFVGRFHYQKGAFKLIDIWKLICEREPSAKLAMIGIGPLEAKIKERLRRLNLENNIALLGFMDGKEKYEIFKQSKIVVHPATYDSGGMAACEAMAWGLPGVSFDLEALKTYYPKGMLKTRCFDLKAFAENIIRLLQDEELYKKAREDALAWAKEWNWDKRANDILNTIKKLFNYGKS